MWNYQLKSGNTAQKGLCKTSPISEEIQQHLKKVYSLLSISLIASIVGSWYQIEYELMTEYVFPYFGCMILIMILIPCLDRSRKLLRISLMLSFGVLQGIMLGPLIEMTIEIDANLVRSAILITVCVFSSFTAMSLMSQKREWLYLGSILNSFCLFLFFMSFFPASVFGYHVSLYGGLIMFCGYVLYDTQVIIDRVERLGIENADWVHDAMLLYIDFIAIFVRILIILLKNRNRNNDNSNASKNNSSVTRPLKIEL